jgi:N-acetylmuramoyl-L-alanine amidase
MKNVMLIIIKKWLLVFFTGLPFLILSFPVIADPPTVEIIPSFPLIITGSLSGKKIGLDPGHGGSDPGAVGWDGPGYPNEEDFNLDVGLKLRTQLQSDSATVVMTRTTDKDMSLDARVNFINNENPHAFISIHCNSFTDPSAHGTETYWHIQGTAEDQKLAGYVQNRLVEKLGTTNRGVKQADFRVLEVNSWIPAVLAEMLFISNQEEFNLINSASGKDTAVSGFRLGICDFFGGCTSGQPDLTPYKPPGWSDKIVVSKRTGTNTDDPDLTTDDTLYVDWAVINQGTADITNRFYYYLYVDGGKKAEWYSDSLPAGWYAYIEDYSIGKLSAGNHTIKIVADATSVISESNESNNEY